MATIKPAGVAHDQERERLDDFLSALEYAFANGDHVAVGVEEALARLLRTIVSKYGEVVALDINDEAAPMAVGMLDPVLKDLAPDDGAGDVESSVASPYGSACVTDPIFAFSVGKDYPYVLFVWDGLYGLEMKFVDKTTASLRTLLDSHCSLVGLQAAECCLFVEGVRIATDEMEGKLRLSGNGRPVTEGASGAH